MITSNVIHRVFRIKTNSGTGSCFTIDYNSKQYIVTARHVLKGWNEKTNLQVYHNKNWISLPCKLTGHAPNNIDVSVIAPPSPISPTHDLPPSNEGIVYGQDVYFLGFPYDTSGEMDKFNRNFPFPLVKKAILSGFYTLNNSEVLLLDGHNNLGFSGGPVVFKAPNSNDFKVASIISSYWYEDYPIFSKKEKKRN